jgi:cytochrome b subunit of formate dehydrogenase
MKDKESNNFKFLVTLSNTTGRMAKGELEKNKIPVKVVSTGTNIPWATINAGAGSPQIFMPLIPVDIYVPENRVRESREIIERFGWDREEVKLPKTQSWQKIWAALLILVFLFFFISGIIMLISTILGFLNE